MPSWLSFSKRVVDKLYQRTNNQNVHSFVASARHEYTSWNGRSIGHWMYACTRDNRDTCESIPVLLVDIWKSNGTLKFLVVRLYDYTAAGMQFDELDLFARKRALRSLDKWPPNREYVISNHFHVVNEHFLHTWSRLSAPAIATDWILDVGENLLRNCIVPEKSDVGRALRMPDRFVYFSVLPREIKDLIYQFVLQREIPQNHYKLVNAQASSHSLHARDGGRGCALLRLETPGVFLVSREFYLGATDCLYRCKTHVLNVTAVSSTFDELHRPWLPRASRFASIQINLWFNQTNPALILERFCCIIKSLRGCWTSLRTLQIRIACLDFATSSERDFRAFPTNVFLRRKDVNRALIRGMEELLLLVRDTSSRPILVRWEVLDYEYRASSLSGKFMEQLWNGLRVASAETGSGLSLVQSTVDKYLTKAHEKGGDGVIVGL